MKVLDYLPLNEDYRGKPFSEDKISIGENADIQGCIFYKCHFDSEESYTKACAEGVCIECSSQDFENYKPDMKYVQAEIRSVEELGWSDTLGVIGDEGTYECFSDQAYYLNKYLYVGTEVEDEIDSVLEAKKKVGAGTQMFKVEDLSLITLPSKEYGVFTDLPFNAYDRMYQREDGDSYEGYLFIPPSSNIAYLFGDEMHLYEYECYAGDVVDAVRKCYPEEEDLIEFIEFQDDGNTFADFEENALSVYLSEDQIQRVFNTLLGIDETLSITQMPLSKLFKTVLRMQPDAEVVDKTIQGVNLGFKTRKSKHNGILFYNQLLIVKNPKAVTKVIL